MANMKDVSKLTGLSLATVSRVFNNSDKVSPATRQIVLEAAAQLDFRPNKMAAALRSGKSKTIGIVVPIIDRDVFSTAIKSMEEVLSAAGYYVIISQSHESITREKEIIENLIQLRVEGIIISVSKETNEMAYFDRLHDNGIALVLFDRSLDTDRAHSVVINNYQGAYEATKHLIGQNCQNIIHLAGKDSVYIFRERRRGFEAAISENGLNLHANSVIYLDDESSAGIQQLTQVLQSDHRPDGIVAHGDISALIAQRIMRALGIRIPDDVAIIGFGDSLFCSYLEPGLSSVSQRSEEVGKSAASILLDVLAEQITTFEQQVLQPELMIRASSFRKT